jgi:hypothetical protein
MQYGWFNVRMKVHNFLYCENKKVAVAVFLDSIGFLFVSALVGHLRSESGQN